MKFDVTPMIIEEVDIDDWFQIDGNMQRVVSLEKDEDYTTLHYVSGNDINKNDPPESSMRVKNDNPIVVFNQV